MIICFVGQPLCGKDTAAKYLAEEKSFNSVSTGDIIRKEMIKKNIPIEPRSNIRLFAEKVRKQYGNQYPANIAAEIISCVLDTVVSGPRNMAEINLFRNKFGKEFILVAIDAPIKMRYKRAMSNLRGRPGDNISFEQFKIDEDIERTGSGAHELDKVMEDANHWIKNDGSEKRFYRKIDCLLKRIIKQC